MKEVKPQEVIMLITPLSKVRDDGEVHSVRCSETFVQTLVRCNDCDHMKWKRSIYVDGTINRCRRCELDNKEHPNDWFCADGKPKEVIEN